MKRGINALIWLLIAGALLAGSPVLAVEGTAVLATVKADSARVADQSSQAALTAAPLVPGDAEAGADGYNLLANETFDAEQGQRTFVLSHPDVSVTSVHVSVDGLPLTREDFVAEGPAGRVTITGAPVEAGSQVRVSYRYGQGSRPSAATTAGSGRLSLGFIYDDGNGDQFAPDVRGGSFNFNGSQNLSLSFGYATSTPAAKRNFSYMREQFARAIAQTRNSLASLSLPSETKQGRALAFGTALQSNRFSVKSDYWAVDPSFELPTDAAAQEGVRSLLAAHGANSDLKKNLGIEHLANSLQVQLPKGFNWSGQYARDENWQPGHKEYGLTRNIWQQSLSGALGRSRTVGFSQVTTRLANDAGAPDRAKSTVETMSFQQNYQLRGVAGSLAWQQQTTYNASGTSGARSKAQVETYTWNGALLSNFAGSGRVTVSEAEGAPRRIERVFDTQGAGLRLNGAMALTGHYEEVEVEGQGTQSKLALNLPAFPASDRVSLQGSYVAQRAANDQTTHESLVRAELRPAPGFSAQAQFRGVEAAGQDYLRDMSVSLSKSLGNTTSLSAVLARQEQGDDKITASKQITLQHSSGLLDGSALYEEFSSGADGGQVHPRLTTTMTLKAMPGVSFTHSMVRRDENEWGGALSREWHLGTRLFNRFDLTGSYVGNPVVKNKENKDELKPERVRTWALGGPLAKWLSMNVNWQLSKNADPNAWQESRSAAFNANLGSGATLALTASQGHGVQCRERSNALTLALQPATITLSHTDSDQKGARQHVTAANFSLSRDLGSRGTVELILALNRQSGPDGAVGQQGLLLNYQRVIDDNHSLRFSATDQPGQFSLFGDKKACALSLATDAKWSLEFKTAF